MHPTGFRHEGSAPDIHPATLLPAILDLALHHKKNSKDGLEEQLNPAHMELQASKSSTTIETGQDRNP